MSLRDLATTALCAPVGTPSSSAAATSANPLSQLAEAVLPTTARPEHAGASRRPPTSSATVGQASASSDINAILNAKIPDQSQYQPQQILEQQLDAPQLPTNLFPNHAPVPTPIQYPRSVPAPSTLPPLPAPGVGDPTDLFERAFRSSAAATANPTAFTHPLTGGPSNIAGTTTAGPAPPPHMTHSYAHQPSMPYHYSSRPTLRSSWRDMNSSLSALSLHPPSIPHHAPIPSMMYHSSHPPVLQPVHKNVDTRTASTSKSQAANQVSEAITQTANVASSSGAVQLEEQRKRETNEQAEVARMREKDGFTNEAISNAVAWGEEFTSLQELNQEQEQLTNDVDDILFDETLQSAFQHWLRRDAPNGYQFSNRTASTTTTESPTQRSAIEALQEGIRAHNESRLSAAVYHLEDALNRSSTTSEESQLPVSKRALAWYILGLSLADLDDDERAIQALCEGLDTYDGSHLGQRREDNPYLWQSLIALAVSYTNELEHSRALRSMREWLDVRNALRNGDGEAGIPQQQHVLGGGVGGKNVNSDVFQRANHEEILQALNQSAINNPQDADVFIVLGILHNLNRDYDSAAVSLRHAVSLRPDASNLWNKLGATLANGGKSDDALRAYRKAVDLQPALVRAWVNVGTAYSNRSEYAKAVRYYLKAISISRESAEKDNPPMKGIVDLDSASSMGHIWGYLRSSLISLSRPDLLHFVESRDLDSLRAHFNF